uniref:Ycf15 n=1 Tax=Romanomermis culicivorax TaxID=13658 RepID=A0A915I805_ROMCU
MRCAYVNGYWHHSSGGIHLLTFPIIGLVGTNHNGFWHGYKLVKSSPIIWYGRESIEHNGVSGWKSKLDESCNKRQSFESPHANLLAKLPRPKYNIWTDQCIFFPEEEKQ